MEIITTFIAGLEYIGCWMLIIAFGTLIISFIAYCCDEDWKSGVSWFGNKKEFSSFEIVVFKVVRGIIIALVAGGAIYAVLYSIYWVGTKV